MSDAPISLRVLTWNIRKAMGTDRRRDPDRILRIISELRADLVLLQEADFRLPPRNAIFDPLEILVQTGLHALQVFPHSPSLGWHGNVMLASPRITAIALYPHPLPGLEPRGVLEAHLSKNGKHFRAFGAHLGLLRSSRRSQLSALQQIVQTQAYSPCLVAGDLNERSRKVGLGRLHKGFNILSGGPTYHARLPMFDLDRIAINNGFECENINAVLTPQTRLASDHLPLVADLTFNPANTYLAKPDRVDDDHQQNF